MTPTIKDKLQFIQEGGAVQRFHVRPGVTVNTDAEHSWGVAMLCCLLSSAPGPSATLLLAALTHDLGEQYVGDTPAPAKWASGTAEALEKAENDVLAHYELSFQPYLSKYELRLLKMADALDGMLHCCREAALGNRTVSPIYYKWNQRVNDGLVFAPYTEHELGVISAIAEIWEESNGIRGPQFDVYAQIKESRT
jgi:5'-deoxynucleotidase YfbR-like HD superfamily hydrolase